MLSEVNSVDDGTQPSVTQQYMCIRAPLQAQPSQQQPRRTLTPAWRPPGTPGTFVMMHQAGNPNTVMASKLDRVKNGLSNVSNRVSPAFLPPPPPPQQIGAASLMSPILPVVSATNFMDSPIQKGAKKAVKPRAAPKKKKDDIAPKTLSSDPTASAAGIVKQRFKHIRPVLGNQQNSPEIKRQKTALELISSNYANSTENLLNTGEANSAMISTQRYAVGCAPTSVYATVHGSDLLTSSNNAYNTVQIPQKPNMPLRNLSFCPSCRTTETCMVGPDYLQCLKCNQQFLPAGSRPKGSESAAMAASNTRSFYSLAHLTHSNTNFPLQPSPQPPAPAAPKRRATPKSSTKKKKHAETIDLISDSEGEEEEEESESTNPEGNSLPTTLPSSDNPAAATSSSSKVCERMKMAGGTRPASSAANQYDNSVATPGQYRTTTPTPPPPQPSPSPSPAAVENIAGEYKFNCNKAMFGELYGETLAPTRCADNRVYLSLQCQMYRDNVAIPEKYTLSVGHNDVQQVLVYFGRVPSFIAIETSTRFAEVACKRIGKEVLVPQSVDPKKRYIILALASAFKVDSEASQELSHLVTCISPWARINVLTVEAARKLIADAELDVNQKELCYGKKPKPEGPAETILIYQPGSKSGGIPVTSEDVACLAEGTYLNDIIIDFYLKYIYESILSPAERQKTYIFNSYFYKRLTQKQGTKFSPEQMHGLVKKWTRNVDIFEKDYIVIPVNEHCHWYLVVVCFPGGNFISEEDLSEKEEEEEEDESADFVKETKSDEEGESSRSNGDSSEADSSAANPASVPSSTASNTSTVATPATLSNPSIAPNYSTVSGASTVSNAAIVSNTSTLSNTPSVTSSVDSTISSTSSDITAQPQHTVSTAASTSTTTNVTDDSSSAHTGTPETPSNETLVPPADTVIGQSASESTPTCADENKETDVPAPAKEKVIYKQSSDADEFIRPCILIFDSLVGSGHSRVFTNLRHYLTQEWALRKPNRPPRIFDKSNMKGCYPKIPRQNNDCDCGAFLLQYVESFFTHPVKSFRIPVHLESWFTLEYVSKKRESIATLITKLASESEKK